MGDIISPNDEGSEYSSNTIKSKFKFGLRRTRTRQFKRMIMKYGGNQSSATRKKKKKKRRNNSDTSETSDEQEMLKDHDLGPMPKSEKHPSISV